MVNKVDGNNYYIYTKQKKIDIPDTGEKFNLGYQKNESSSEAKDKEEISGQERQQKADGGGVRLELSGRGQDGEADRRKQAGTAKARSAPGQVPLLETIRKYIMIAIAAVQDFFHNIWNDQPAGDDLQDILQDDVLDSMETSEITEIIDTSGIEEEALTPAMEEERRNREIQQSLRDGDMDQVINLLTDNGKRTIAKNSTLLTSYDRNGRVVELNASDRERALHGDRNTWKL